jgi:hypothetical protein
MFVATSAVVVVVIAAVAVNHEQWAVGGIMELSGIGHVGGGFGRVAALAGFGSLFNQRS